MKERISLFILDNNMPSVKKRVQPVTPSLVLRQSFKRTDGSQAEGLVVALWDSISWPLEPHAHPGRRNRPKLKENSARMSF